MDVTDVLLDILVVLVAAQEALQHAKALTDGRAIIVDPPSRHDFD